MVLPVRQSPITRRERLAHCDAVGLVRRLVLVEIVRRRVRADRRPEHGLVNPRRAAKKTVVPSVELRCELHVGRGLTRAADDRKIPENLAEGRVHAAADVRNVRDVHIVEDEIPDRAGERRHTAARRKRVELPRADRRARRRWRRVAEPIDGVEQHASREFASETATGGERRETVDVGLADVRAAPDLKIRPENVE